MRIQGDFHNPAHTQVGVLHSIIPLANEINEEMLFRSVVQARLQESKGSALAETFNVKVTELLSEATQSRRHMQIEDAVVSALDSMVTEKQLSKAERDTIYAESFRAAQLDSNLGALYDSRGGKNDTTIAVATRDVAIQYALKNIEGIQTGSISVDRTLGDTKRSNMTAPLHGFLFKPLSENEGTVAVLIPAQMGRGAASVRLVDSGGRVIEEGRFTSFGETGARAKYAFSKRGEAYPKGISLEIVMKDGSRHSIAIPDPARRQE